MKNITYIISFVNKSASFEWIVENIDRSKFCLSFILLNNKNSQLEDFLRKNNIQTFRINYNGKRDIPYSTFKTITILKKIKTDIVHCHLFDACIVGLTAAKLANIKRRIHTRHNATIHHEYHPKAVKYDKYINYLSTEIIAISENVRNILLDLENVDPGKITLIHHGFKLSEFDNIPTDRIKNIYIKNSIPTNRKPLIGVISRYIHWKGIQNIIPAFKLLIQKYPQAHLVLANSAGPYKREISSLLNELPKSSYTEIEFEEDIFALFKIFDIFIHTPIDEKSEAFGQVYVETMASGVPSIVTLSGIASEYIENKKNAIVVPFNDHEAVLLSILELLSNENLKINIIDEGKKSITRLFSIELMISKLENLYGK